MNSQDLIKEKEKGCGLKESCGSPTCEKDCLCNDCELEFKALEQMNKLWEDKLKDEGIIFLAGEICFDEKASPKFTKWLDKLLDKREKYTNKLWLDRIDELDIELFLEDVVDVKTGKKIEIPKEVLDLWDIYWQHIKEKLKSEDKNGSI